MKKILLIMFFLAGLIFLSGCNINGVLNKFNKVDVTPLVKTLPEVQSFLKAHPNAEIKATLWSENAVAQNIQDIKKDCGNQMEIKSYWKVEITEEAINLLVWLDVQNKQPVCIYQKGKGVNTERSEEVEVKAQTLTKKENKKIENEDETDEEETEKETCSDECTIQSCDGLNYIDCVLQTNGCLNKINQGKKVGKCSVECLSDSYCDEDEECFEYKCIEKEEINETINDTKSELGESCASTTDCIEGLNCKTSALGGNNTCVECYLSSHCDDAEGGVCDVLTNECHYCSGNTSHYYSTGQTCVECYLDSHCVDQEGGVCDVLTHNCRYCSGDTPNYYLAGHECVECYLDSQCSADEECDIINKICMQKEDAGLVGYWSFDEGSGTIAGDDSQYNNDGTIINANWVNGKRGTALSFEGGGNSYVTIPDSSELQIDSSDYTLEAWVNPNAYYETYDRSEIISTRSGYTEGYSLSVQGMASSTPKKAKIEHWVSGGGDEDYLVSESDIPLNAWTHIAVTFDYSTQETKIYINGELDNTGTIRHMNAPPIGIEISREMYDHSKGLDGVIDEVKIYNYIRSDEQINEDAQI